MQSPAKPDIKELNASFRRFVSARTPSESYLFQSCPTCPLAQFGQTIITDRPVIGGTDSFYFIENEEIHEWKVLNSAAEIRALLRENTFGDLAERLEELSA